MDGSCKKNLGQLLFLSVALACSTMLQAQERQRLGLLPAVFATSASPASALSDSSNKFLLNALQRQLSAAFAVEQSFICVRLDAPHALDLYRADSVRLFCQTHQVEKLLSPSLEASFDPASMNRRNRVSLRWLDAASGEMTKFHTVEFENAMQDTALSGFDARAALRALLEAPELILTQEQQVALLPALRDLPAPAEVQRKSRRWLWYVSAAALLSGSSAYLLLEEKEASRTKRLLPEPPGPPPQ
jgi:hypothetical protein